MKERTPEQLKGQVRSFAAKRNLQPQEVLQMYLLERVLERLLQLIWACFTGFLEIIIRLGEKENIDVFDFSLSENEMNSLKSLDNASPMIGNPENPEKTEFVMTW